MSGYISPDVQIILAVIVIVLIIVIYMWFNRPTDKKKRKLYKNLYQKSNGGYDKNAETTLEIINDIEKTDANDEYTAGNILELNVLQGNIAIEDDNHVTATETVNRYNNTLNRVQTDVVNRNRGRAVIDATANIAYGFMVDHIGNFIENAINDHAVLADGAGGRIGGGNDTPVVYDDYLTNLIINEVIVGDQFIDQMMPGFLDMARRTDDTRKLITEDKISKAYDSANNKNEFTSEYIKLSKTATSDTQNVHDTSVKSDYKKTVEKIRATSTLEKSSEAIDEINKYIDYCMINNKLNKTTGMKAKRVVSKMGEGAKIMVYDDTEDMILKYVWERSKIPENKLNKEAIQDSIVVCLSQCVEASPFRDDNRGGWLGRGPIALDNNGVGHMNNGVTNINEDAKGEIVCINGRVSNVLGSLVTLDHDKSVGAALTEEQYKNEIFNQCKIILDEEISIAEEGSDELKNLAKSYIDPNISVDEKVEKKFKNIVKARIDTLLDTYSDRILGNQLAAIRKDCYISVDCV
jgi:hypothetical protein